jgi:hypothetical protein
LPRKLAVDAAGGARRSGEERCSDAWRIVMDKLLVSLRELVPLRGRERMQEIYIVTLGYDPAGKADSIEHPADGSAFFEALKPENAKLRKWYYGIVTPILKIRKGKGKRFPGGLPLFYGEPGKFVSFYFAVWESDKRGREAGRVLSGLMKKAEADPLLGSVLEIAKIARPTANRIASSFPMAIKAIEVALLKNKDDLRYTNVFTFRKSEDFLAGTHRDWGDHRIKLTIDAKIVSE